MDRRVFLIIIFAHLIILNMGHPLILLFSGSFQIISKIKLKFQPISEAVFLGAMDNYDVLFEWAHDKCVPLVREITFSNGEELTEEGLPFLILFHRAEDTESLKKFTEEISRSLIEERVRP